MKIEDITAAISEAERFIERANHMRGLMIADDARVKAVIASNPDAYTWHQSFPKESGSVRRASMDLTRALAKMRGAA